MSGVMVGAQFKHVAKCAPFFVDQRKEAVDGAIERIQHDLQRQKSNVRQQHVVLKQKWQYKFNWMDLDG